MHKTLIASALAAAFFLPATVFAQAAAPAAAPEAAPAAAPSSPFTGNVMLASEYLYRGIAQTRGKPAIQGGFDYAHPNGFYIGTWGSSISWIGDTVPGASASLELDIYGGYKGSITDDLGYDVGILTYNYPGTNKPVGNAKPDTTEVYGALTWKWLSVKYSQTTGSLFGWTTAAGKKTSGSGYLDVTGTFDLGDGLGVNAHAGHQSVKGRSSASYSDWKVGVTKEVGIGTVGLSLLGTDAKDSCAKGGEDYCFGGYSAGKSRVLLSFGKTF
jgi:uncharacterized protein (TIGR02001 family)